MKQPLISVVVPVYNVEEYIRDCIDSIRRQTYENLEIIIVDDGSTDTCPAICDEYGALDNRIKIIHQENAGLAGARNTGIDCMTGQFVTFVDSDDYLSDDMVEYLYTNLVNFEVDISLCQSTKVYEKGLTKINQTAYDDVIVGRTTKDCLKEFFINNRIDTVAWAKLYKTEMFKDIRYPYGKYHEDIFTTYKLISKCSAIFVGGERKYFYRVRNQSIMTSVFSPKHLHIIEGKCEQNNFIENKYPELAYLSQADIISSCNVCARRIVGSSMDCSQYVPMIQSYYRKYEYSYLKAKHVSLTGKIFSVLAFVDLNALLKICTLLRIKL